MNNGSACHQVHTAVAMYERIVLLGDRQNISGGKDDK